MRYVDNEGNEIEKPTWPAPIQGFEERMGLSLPSPPLVAGKLNAEHAAILSAPEGVDRRDLDYFVGSGQGLAEFFKAFAAASPSDSMLQKAIGTGPLNKKTPFTKVDEAKREVWGVVTAQVPDKDDEVCDFEKSLPYYRAWVDEFQKSTNGESYGNLREMHQLSAVGKAIAFDPRSGDKQIVMGFKVVDDNAWKKVMQRVYTGFSHGGEKVGAMWPDPDYHGCMRYVAKPSEVSLVDNPCLGTAHYTLIRADGRSEVVKVN